MGAHGLKGTGVGCVCRSPGSKKEKKLWESECLWWCPRRDVAPDDIAGMGCSIDEAELGEVEFVEAEGRGAPNVKPSRKERCPGPGDALGMGMPAEWSFRSSSCVPSSEIVVDGREPGRGKRRKGCKECVILVQWRKRGTSAHSASRADAKGTKRIEGMDLSGRKDRTPNAYGSGTSLGERRTGAWREPDVESH
ncbi:hypothetical protein A0H81_03324 [Grifola frondosa]|uniref:Uncharacterized protein n=1 Tax=Grifola frondosa TaxID=5627 RepID=A0A1C7MJA7_GRIFR|nr:hypothetical protein A0H81_03324 [Grifola frondosa]